MVKQPTICLLGASFNTGNLGVSALAESSIKLLIARWPDCEIVFAGSEFEPKKENIIIAAKQEKITSVPIRFSKDIFHPCHFLRFVFYALLKKTGFKKAGNTHFRTLTGCEFICDITGGDSFSDIYGFKRFFLGFLTKWLFIFLDKDLILLPQTYGPFKKKITQIMAAYILRKAKMVYSRDKAGVQYARQLLKGRGAGKVKLCPDVAFVLDAQPWDDRAIEQVLTARDEGQKIIGLNINGLLFNGGYTKDNMFGLAVDYPQLIGYVIDYFLAMDDVTVVLAPHVFPKDIDAIESDPAACEAIYNSLTNQQQKNVIFPKKVLNQRQIKYLIGLCDFFVGSRMHSCIAAISQSVPAVGLAYSKKFEGVFEAIGLQDCVVDMRSFDDIKLLEQIKVVFRKASIIQSKLNETIPIVKQKVHSLFAGME